MITDRSMGHALIGVATAAAKVDEVHGRENSTEFRELRDALKYLDQATPRAPFRFGLAIINGQEIVQ